MNPPRRPAPEVTWRQVDGEVVLLDLKAGRYFGLNPTAAFIWICLVEPADGKSAPADYAARFGVTLEQAVHDFKSLTRDFERRGFLS